jgi:transposase
LFNLGLKDYLIPELKLRTSDHNATFHKSKESLNLIEKAGCRVLFFPLYSPDLNPIEIFGQISKRESGRIWKH